MNLPCGCCEGTEILTPMMTANRPGLPALSYRVGTHATFLETMKARLSNLYLEIPDNLLDDQGRSKFARIYPLRGLKTRDPGDAAIALLDAWAVVGDVLTFYQERIANEGYLRTATERRSILELARLIGYTLRPGVAATTYLAYTLDEDRSATPPKSTAVTIPAGTRAQSVPGPGELPQSFETADEFEAHSDWNNLQVRLTQPQLITTGIGTTTGTGTIYFKGIATNLKPNDPLLINFGTAQELYRVIEVTPNPDPAADRTKVTIQRWLPSTAPAAAPIPRAAVGARQLSDAVRDIVTRFSDVKPFGVAPTSRSTRNVLEDLDRLRTILRTAKSAQQVKTKLETEILPGLKEIHRVAVESRFTRVEPWVRGLVAELEAAATAVSSTNPGASSSDPAAPVKRIEASATQPGVTSLPGVLTSLAKPPSQPPANSLRLPRSVEQTFAEKTDITAQLLTKFRPEVADILYRAWENVPVTPEPAVEVYALRTKAGVFGNNAPLEPVKRSDGVTIGSKEWDLKKFTSVAAGHFKIELELRVTENNTKVAARTRITILGQAVEDPAQRTDPPRTLVNGTFTLSLPAPPNETIKVTVTEIRPQEPPPFLIMFEFPSRRLVVTVRQNSAGQLEVNSTPSDLATVTAILSPEQIVFGAVTPGTPDFVPNVIVDGEIQELSDPVLTETANVVWLDAPNDQIVPQTWVAIERPVASDQSQTCLVITKANQVSQASRADYGVTAKTTAIQLNDDWIDPNTDTDTFAVIRGTAVFAQSEKLTLAEEPIATPVCGGEIELDGLYDGLESGRWLIVSGERTDIAPGNSQSQATRSDGQSGDTSSGQQAPIEVKGVPASELVMLAGVEQTFDETLPGDKTHSTLLLAEPLKYCYLRASMKIYGNVVKATHGETRNEVLGNGDGSKALQQFTLKQPPLTFVSAPNPSGIESTLQVRVNDVLWHEIDSLANSLPTDREFITLTDDEGNTTVIFGNGKRGARLPTGQANVKAVYRNGIGKPGNVKAEQITLLVTRPLGVKEVTNPLRASGGADKESRDQARQNAPLAVMALDRLVSTSDYADFARTFTGIGKASAMPLSDGRRQLVHVTIAGADDIPIDEHSDLFQNLRRALRQFGDPSQPIQLATRKLLLLVIQANVRMLPDYLWEKVEPKVRTALLERFSFARCELGQDTFLSEAFSTIQSVEGVAYVDVDTFDAVDEDKIVNQLAGTAAFSLGRQERIAVHLAQIDPNEPDPDKRIQPAQLAYFSPDVTDTIILTEMTA